MRSKKNREVNIFSASVVDLFASGLGVFLIVSIIALVNQKKESSKSSKGEVTNASAELVKELESDIEDLKSKVQKLQNNNFELKRVGLSQKSLAKVGVKEVKQQSKNIESVVHDLKLKLKFSETSRQRVEASLNEKIVASKLEIQHLRDELRNTKVQGGEVEKKVEQKLVNFKVGSKFVLEDVHFYPGTKRPIEPYASQEVKAFANFLKKNPQVYIEVSGHIFETKKVILAGKAEDTFDLSGKRAKAVCDKFIDFGISDKRLSCTGYGAKRYIHLTDDQYSEKAQKNRRVEIEILSK